MHPLPPTPRVSRSFLCLDYCVRTFGAAGASMAERAAASAVSSPQLPASAHSGSPSAQAPSDTPQRLDIFKSPAHVTSSISSPSSTGVSSKSVREEQLGKVRDNLLAAEMAIEKLRQQAAKAISVSMRRLHLSFLSSVHTWLRANPFSLDCFPGLAHVELAVLEANVASVDVDFQH